MKDYLVRIAPAAAFASAVWMLVTAAASVSGSASKRQLTRDETVQATGSVPCTQQIIDVPCSQSACDAADNSLGQCTAISGNACEYGNGGGSGTSCDGTLPDRINCTEQSVAGGCGQVYAGKCTWTGTGCACQNGQLLGDDVPKLEVTNPGQQSCEGT